MPSRLAELAARSASLREAVFEKEAGPLAMLGLRAAKGIGSWAMKNKGTTLGLGLTAAIAPGAIKGSYQQAKAGFDPAVQQAMLGPVPGV